MGAKLEKKRFRVNTNLITLKVVVFFVFLGIGSIQTLCTYQHQALGLNFEEFRLITILAPLISTIGPLIAGPLADKLAARNSKTFGRSLRYLTAFFLIMGSIFYACILLIPSVKRMEVRRPLVSFGCDSSGAVIFQERCTEEQTCHHWSKEKYGNLILTNCSYTCQKPSQYEFLYQPWTKGSEVPPTELITDTDWNQEYVDISAQTTTESTRSKRDFLFGDESLEVFSDEENDRNKRQTEQETQVLVNPPHLCIWGKDVNGTDRIEKCHVYTENTASLKIQATIHSAINQENDTHSADWCNYPLDGFQCDIPDVQVSYMKSLKNHTNCKPMMECEVIDPYDSPESVLADSTCINTIGDVDTTVFGYGALRIIADIFPLGALTLINTAIVIATRETSLGRGEVCRQYVWGSLAWVLSFPHSEAFGVSFFNINDYIIALTVTAVISFVIAAVILLFAQNIPLSPPEWWWHTKTGMLVYPMSAIRKYAPETLALTLIALILGMFFGSIHSYLLYVHVDFNSVSYLGLLLVLLLLFNVDKFIEYCGHSNILISTFAFYIIRFTSIAMITEKIGWLALVMEIFEPLALGLSWITIILYMRHIFPRKFTATGQAIVIIAHFCIGKGFGALIGLAIDSRNPMQWNCMYHGLAIAACVIAIIYFIIYNLVLAPRLSAKAQPQPPLTHLAQPAQNGGATNGTNGNYTPLRVYHNERGKKGQYRY